MKLVTPEGMDTRPTQDIIKETLFNMIQFEVPGSVFVDLCAGSGQMGIEALSRGARRAYFIENDKKAIACIQKNIHTTRFEEEGVIIKQDALNALRHIHEKEVHIIYMDPPYESDLARNALEILSSCSYVTEETLIIVETSLESDFSDLEDSGFEIVREKDYKTNRHLFIRKITEA